MREVLHGQPWIVAAQYVVEDDGETLVTFIQTGTEFGFPPGPRVHPWAELGRTHWAGHGKLTVSSAGDPFSIQVFWHGPRRRFAGWCVNLQDSIRRHERGVDTLDHELDLIVDLDGGVHDKDVELFEQRVREGRYPEPQTTRIRAIFGKLREPLCRNGVRVDRRWAEWEPPPSWGPLSLPEGWEATAATAG